jgi:aryl-alcohol dehydrogenase-like predicted oxidoreductase
MKRRSFLKTVAAGASAVASQVQAQPAATEPAATEVVNGMPRRPLGRTGQRVSIVGYPGFALREEGYSQKDYTASIDDALSRGVNYFDVAPAYANTLCEQRMGKAFAEIGDFDRESIVLACKTKERTKAGAQKELENSLKLLKTDYFDIYQLHCLMDPAKDVDRAFAKDGAMEAIFAAQKQGKIRYIGYSAHTTAAALAALNRYQFDTVMFPINFVEMFTFNFGKKVLDLAAQQGAAVLAIKTLGHGQWPAGKRHRNWWYRTLEDQEDINLAYRYTLAQKPVAAGLPPAWMDLAKRAVTAGRAYHPLTDADDTRLRQLAANAGPVFLEQEKIARHEWDGQHCPVGPHEQCPGMMS